MYKYHIYFDQFYYFYFLRDNFKGHQELLNLSSVKNAVEFVVSTNSSSSREGQFQWDSEILEFLDTIEYYGHEATVHLLRGPGFYKTAEERKTAGERKAGKFDWSTWNWPLPGRTTRQKQSKGRYTTDSGIYWPLVQNFLSILSDPNSGIAPIFLDQESYSCWSSLSS